jgi:hypothetical protein
MIFSPYSRFGQRNRISFIGWIALNFAFLSVLAVCCTEGVYANAHHIVRQRELSSKTQYPPSNSDRTYVVKSPQNRYRLEVWDDAWPREPWIVLVRKPKIHYRLRPPYVGTEVIAGPSGFSFSPDERYLLYRESVGHMLNGAFIYKHTTGATFVLWRDLGARGFAALSSRKGRKDDTEGMVINPHWRKRNRLYFVLHVAYYRKATDPPYDLKGYYDCARDKLVVLDVPR